MTAFFAFMTGILSGNDIYRNSVGMPDKYAKAGVFYFILGILSFLIEVIVACV